MRIDRLSRMNPREYFTKRFKIERRAFSEVIKAMPDDKLDYKPNEKNSSAAMGGTVPSTCGPTADSKK
jgi:hypothetical protein